MVYEAASLRQIFRSPTSEQKVRISPHKYYNRVIAEMHYIYMMSHNPSYRIASHWETFIRLQEAKAPRPHGSRLTWILDRIVAAGAPPPASRALTLSSLLLRLQ